MNKHRVRYHFAILHLVRTRHNSQVGHSKGQFALPLCVFRLNFQRLVQGCFLGENNTVLNCQDTRTHLCNIFCVVCVTFWYLYYIILCTVCQELFSTCFPNQGWLFIVVLYCTCIISYFVPFVKNYFQLFSTQCWCKTG